MKNLLVGQSGGPTAVINSSLAGVIARAKKEDKIAKVYGMIHGVEGYLKGKKISFDEYSTQELALLKTTPGPYLGSCRFKLPEDFTAPVYDEIFARLDADNIGYFLYIGGNDSMDTVSKLSRVAKQKGSEIVFLGIPKTVDNDLVLTDHTPGFGSAAKYIAASVRNVVADTDAYDMKSVTIIEVMGRHAGWLVGATALARRYEGDNPALIYLPEVPFVEEQFIADVKAELTRRNSVVICVSEGIKNTAGQYVAESSVTMQEDSFGHKLLSGAAPYLESLVREKVGVKVRSFNPGLTQRAASQSLSAVDVEEAFMAGEYGVCQALQGQTGKMITFVRKEGTDYSVECGLEDVNLICNKEKKVPAEWICGCGHDVKTEFLTYIKPLLTGEIYPPFVDGLPEFLTRR